MLVGFSNLFSDCLLPHLWMDWSPSSAHYLKVCWCDDWILLCFLFTLSNSIPWFFRHSSAHGLDILFLPLSQGLWRSGRLIVDSVISFPSFFLFHQFLSRVMCWRNAGSLMFVFLSARFSSFSTSSSLLGRLISSSLSPFFIYLCNLVEGWVIIHSFPSSSSSLPSKR